MEDLKCLHLKINQRNEVENNTRTFYFLYMSACVLYLIKKNVKRTTVTFLKSLITNNEQF